MTNYGAIPTSSHTSPSPAVDGESLSSDDQCTTCTMPRRPWGVMFDFHSMGLPRSFSDASSRFKTNYNYFRTNYGFFVFPIIWIDIFVSLIKHPVSLVAFTVLVFIYIFLYCLQDNYEPVQLFCCRISDRMIRIVKSCLMFSTIALLVVTNANVIFGWPLWIVYVLILIHAVVRKTEDLFVLDEESATMNETYGNPLDIDINQILTHGTLL
ncbi:hypothetical protein Bca4012_068844 [Brassica carinata]